MGNGREIVVVGAGKIGNLVVAQLAKAYRLWVYDSDLQRARACAVGLAEAGQLDAGDQDAVVRALEGKSLVINCCPHFCNVSIAQAALRARTSYLDLSEDVESGNKIEEMSREVPSYFVPRSGVAPGFIQIVTSHIMRAYDAVEEAQLRVGALPENPTNALKYNLTWSTDGLINEYANPCEALVQGQFQMLAPLEGYERIVIDGVEYEAFNTSGGLGTLPRSLLGRVKNLNYKTIRYLGHRDLMKFLLFDLKLHEYRAILKQILESAVPATDQDMVLIVVSVTGIKQGLLTQQTYSKTIRHGQAAGRHRTAIQLATASSAAAVADLIMRERLPHRGCVRQEEIDFHEFCATPYGALFKEP